MKHRAIAALLLLASTALFAATKAPAPKAAAPRLIAPDTMAHQNAMFLASLSNRGARRVMFRAAAISTRFFLEEPSGVTVYVYDGLDYRREAFLKGSTLQKAMKAYSKKK